LKKMGFIGVGTIAEAFVNGIMASGKAPEIMLSPRSEVVSARLADRYANVTRATSNIEVARASHIVFLAMRPAQVESALEGVTFRPDQILCSFVTGLMLDDLREIAPAATVCRVLPLPMVAFNKGPLIHVPHVPAVLDVLDGMGDVVLPNDEDELVALGGASGFMSTFFELQNSLSEMLSGKGVSASTSRAYVCSMFAGLAETSLRASETLLELGDEHETRGGLNERTRRALKKEGWFDSPSLAIAEVASIGRKGLQ
jgi:pyrroline-5-carboxylate reductase